ncbi:hypothetical protein HDU96_009481 [Phlyctochytrium bullatum]|nr:hypothetical protein HDU96_009481 [Phlyctochytrium bullatum]
MSDGWDPPPTSLIPLIVVIIIVKIFFFTCICWVSQKRFKVERERQLALQRNAVYGRNPDPTQDPEALELPAYNPEPPKYEAATHGSAQAATTQLEGGARAEVAMTVPENAVTRGA